MIIIMTMTMTEIVDLETGIDCTIEIDHIVEIGHETTIKMITKIIIGITMKMIIEMITKMITEIAIKMIIGMIIEMTSETTIEMTTEMTVEKKIIGISKNRNVRESTEIIMTIYMKTGTTGIIIEIVIKTKIVIETNIETSTEMTVMTKSEVGLKKKITYMMIEKMIVLKQNLKGCTTFCKQ